MLTADRLRHVLAYDPETGLFQWRNPPGRRGKAGDAVGCANSAGYLRVMVDKRSYLLHRLAWLFMTGVWPTGNIDHIDGNPLNNRIVNLRECTQSQNAGNSRAQRRNTSGIKGVSLNKASGKWFATIGADGKSRHLGRFATKEQAAEAYANAALAQFGEFARLA